jgi:spore coat polysaccharide biosynthesis protein SpsF
VTRVGIITQARTTSSRLPRKVLLSVDGKTLLEHHLDRLAMSGLPVLVATTANSTDDEIASLSSARGLGVYRGSETDVLARYHGCADAFGLDIVVRVTSDCPLIDGGLIASAVSEYLAVGDPWLYMSNTLERTYPRGFDFEVFSASALGEAAAKAVESSEREHVTPYLYARTNERTHRRNVARHENKSAYRITLDTAEDLALIRVLIEEHGAASLSGDEIIQLLDAHPELVEMNAHVEQKKLGD